MNEVMNVHKKELSCDTLYIIRKLYSTYDNNHNTQDFGRYETHSQILFFVISFLRPWVLTNSHVMTFE